MEAVFFEVSAITFGAAFAGLIALLVAAYGIFLAGLAEAEIAGTRFAWAEWPLPETVAPPEETRLPLAA